MTDKDKAELVYTALGGAGEIGMNCYLYGLGRGSGADWIVVDLGIGFGDMETSPGVELVLPDIGFLRQISKRVKGLFVTHAHEDHIGAIPHLWASIGAPIYARPFTAELVRRKLEEAGQDTRIVREVSPGQAVDAGRFSVRFLPITHSIPEASMLAIAAPQGTVVHSGDFKLDPDPQLGDPYDLSPYEELGREGVLALACDSTNVFLAGQAGSESEITANLRRIIRAAPGAVAATSFASNVARLKTLATAAHDVGRSIVVAGRAMRRMIEVAVETGQLKDFPPVVPDDQASQIPRENLFFLVTGSQGEARAALARIAGGSHPSVKLRDGDTVLFSSKTIPGNEAGIYRLYNKLSEQGIRVIDSEMERIHVSGHARRDDLEKIYEVLKPKVSVPIHGEHRHLVEHAKWAREWGASHALVVPNGSVARLDGNSPGVVDEVETGRIYLDGHAMIGAMDGVIRDRLKLARQGHVVLSLVIDEDGTLIADPDAKVIGGPQQHESWPDTLAGMIAEAVDEAIEGAAPKAKRTDAAVEDLAGKAARRVCTRYWGKKPVMTVMVTRLEDED
ncbi:ribonuclease J [Paralimibaculum aggregatum]|uniref:Ribonuclease J n=1 Tax=Paralimibaculum aggregatum TaxID=3036245 RepID=A0ABQ6LT23_9RHOB|nr:ribonuclease J [Limibaculum sp. NKW23]GMG85216.1 ribonuclease J [Limibaculum sp. NKW23]